MNTKSLIAFAAIAFAGTAAMAQEVTVDSTPFHATRTRAEVQAEVLKARAAGVLQFSTEFDSQVAPVMAVAPSALTRAEVRAEAVKAVRSPRNESANGYIAG
jgi:hypothetical protein